MKGPDGKYQICEMATSGKQLIDKYTERLRNSLDSNGKMHPFKVIITDLHMPGMTGY